MKIAIMAAWNTDSGVAMHAEPIGKAFLELGHEIVVFSFIKSDFHGESITAEDEKYVHRCFGTRQNTNHFNVTPLIENTYDVLMVEDIGMLPVDKLADLMPSLKKKAKVVHVVHENHLCEDSWFYKIDWDLMVYFDKRQHFLHKTGQKSVFIPFPCYKKRHKSQEEARKALNLPLNKKVILSFGLRSYKPILTDLSPEMAKKAIIVTLVTENSDLIERPNFIVRHCDKLTSEEFDNYFIAADAAVLHKYLNNSLAVLSSTAYQAMGTGCLLFGPAGSDFFENWGDEIVKYESKEQLEALIAEYLNSPTKRVRTKIKASQFVETHSPSIIAQNFIKEFRKLLNNGKK